MADDKSCPDDLVEPPAPVDTGTHGLVLLPEMEPTVRSLERAFAAAKRRVHIECYIVRDDRFGTWLVDRLAEAAGRGVEAKLLYDPLGSEETAPAFFAEAARRGIDVRPYRGPQVVLSSGAPFPRDHGRIFVVDDAAWTGGIAFRDEWLPARRGGEGWHDVSLQVAWGPVVEDFEHVFQTRWREAVGDDVPCDVHTGDRHRDVQLIADCPRHATLVYDAHRRAIRAARRRIWMENAYFFPPAAMLKDLVEAADRGVDVRVMMPADSDLPIIEGAARAEYASWIRHGIRVFLYRKCMNHAKLAVIDDDWCTVGTFNANPTSMAMCNEVNLIVFHRAFVEAVAGHFASDLAHCEELAAEALERRPLLVQATDRVRADLLNLGDLAFGKRDGTPPARLTPHD